MGKNKNREIRVAARMGKNKDREIRVAARMGTNKDREFRVMSFTLPFVVIMKV